MAETPKDERTEEATARKLEQAREEGQVAFSTESVAALGLIVALGTFLFAGGLVARRIGAMLTAAPRQALHFGELDLDNESASVLLGGIGRETMIPLMILVLPMTISALMIGFGQAGFGIAPKAIKADPSKLSPIKGFSRMVGARGWTRVGLAILKILAIGIALIVTGIVQIPKLVAMGMTDLGPMLAALGAIMIRCVSAVVACVVVLAVVDLIFQRKQFQKEQRMTKQEIKEEMKQQEGDPHVKARIRAVQREMANRRMMSDVKEATAVITNPTHFAVAIKYPRDEDGTPLLHAPMVVAKGIDFMALNIKKVAREAGIPCHEDRPLARAMHARVEVGHPIPEDLYAAVATVLAAVWRAEEQAKSRGALAAS